MTANERSKPDLRLVVHVNQKCDYGMGPFIKVKATVAYIDDDQYVRSPSFSTYEQSGAEPYEGLAITAQISAYKGVVADGDFYGRTVAFYDLYAVNLDHAESNVKVLRRIGRHLDKLEEQFGRTDYAGMCGRLAHAIGTTAAYPIGRYSRDEMFADGTHYKWMTVDWLRDYLNKEIADWMEANNLHKRDVA